MNGFLGALYVEFLPGGDRKRWLLKEDLTYIDATVGRTYTASRGFITDFASIPRPLWAWLPPAGEYAPAAVIHDWLYWWGKDDKGEPVTRALADAVFRRAMADLGVGSLRRKLMWLGVRVGGWKAWASYREERPR